MFHIIENWFMVPWVDCWMIAEKTGESKRKDGTVKTEWSNQIYMSTPESALKVFARDYVRLRASRSGATGELKDLMMFLSSEYEKLSARIDEAVAWSKERRDTGERNEDESSERAED